jgi:hypothetical protein
MIVNELTGYILAARSICLIMLRLAFKLHKWSAEAKIQIKVCTFAS